MKRTEAEKRLIKDIQRIKHNLERSTTRVSKYEQQYNTPSPALKRFKSLGKISVKGKDLKQLRKLHRQLVYIKGLKTSKVKGFKHYIYVFKEVLRDIPKNIEKKFWEIYNHAVEENGLWEQFKYDLMVEIHEDLEAGIDEDDIYQKINELYDKLEESDVIDEHFYKKYYETSDWT